MILSPENNQRAQVCRRKAHTSSKITFELYAVPIISDQTGTHFYWVDLYASIYGKNTHFLFLFVNQDTMFTLSVPLGVVSRVDKVGGIRSSGENSYGIEILCKVRSLEMLFNCVFCINWDRATADD